MGEMKKPWTVTIRGVRGSMPAVSGEYLEYGGNTACTVVDCGGRLILFDAGSGLTGPWGRLPGRKRADLFISHVHMDHIIGLFGFGALHNPEMDLHLYGEARDGVSFRRQLEFFVGPPYWPIGFGDFRARVTIHEIGPGACVSLGDGLSVRVMRGNHPNLSLLYRLDGAGHSVVHTLDCEMNDTLFAELCTFAQDADLLLWDASFTDADLARHPGWGHSSWRQGIDLGKAARVKTVLMSHYSSDYTDQFLHEQERQALSEAPDGIAVRFAREEMEVHL